MKYVFSATGMRNLEAFCFSKCLYAFDYDGTLAKIVRNPAEASMSGPTRQLLCQLNQVGPVAIISGRSLRDLRSLVKVPPRYMIGNHGLEGLPDKQFSNVIASSCCGKWKKALAKMVPSDLGVEIEDKSFSLALHYRKSRAKRDAKASILDAVSRLNPSPRVIMGKSVVNLVPSGGPHKGIALMELMLEVGRACAIYIGDDDTDEDVFGLPESRILTIRVGQKRGSRARFFLKRQSEVSRLIRQILKFIGEVRCKV